MGGGLHDVTLSVPMFFPGGVMSLAVWGHVPSGGLMSFPVWSHVPSGGDLPPEGGFPLERGICLPPYGGRAGATHPTGMHSCCVKCFAK